MKNLLEEEREGKHPEWPCDRYCNCEKCGEKHCACHCEIENCKCCIS